MRCTKIEDAVLCLISILIVCWMAYEGMMVSATSNFSLLFSVAALKRDTQYLGNPIGDVE